VTGIRIGIARTGTRTGYLIAVMAACSPYVSAERLVVGDVRRISPDEEPEEWWAWLWPVAGGSMHTTASCDAADAETPEKLLERLQKRADKTGAWWKAAGPEKAAEASEAVA
jgi:hypothetical protein